MPYLYPIPNATTPESFISYPNDVTGGMFWNLILVGIFFIIFSVQKRKNYSTPTSFATTSFFVAMITMGLSLIPNLISSFTVLITTVMAIFGFMILLFQKKT